MAKRGRHTEGLTLAELLISVAIVLILAAIAFPSIVSAQNNMRMLELNNAAQSIANAAQAQMTAKKVSGTWVDLSLIHICTTKRGIGPCYQDKVARKGIRIQDLLDEKIFRLKLEAVLSQKNPILEKIYGLHTYTVEEICEEYLPYARILKPYMAETCLLYTSTPWPASPAGSRTWTTCSTASVAATW